MLTAEPINVTRGERRPARIIDPPLEALTRLRQPLNEGELRVLDWFMQILPSGWEIYIQPHLNGLRPDFVLMHPQRGVAVYEVKDWNLLGMDYFVEPGRHGPQLMGYRDGKTFRLGSRDPVAAIDLYKSELSDLYVPSLTAAGGFGLIVAGIIFTSATTQAAIDLLGPLRDSRGHSKLKALYPVIGAEMLEHVDDHSLRILLPTARKIDIRMDKKVAAELRHWLVEPSFSRDQRAPLSQLMTPKQKSLCLNREKVRFRRIRGPAGCGKSLVLAGRASELAAQGKRVLIVTFNITLINYLLDLAVQYSQSGKVRDQITALNFHHLCKRISELVGSEKEYESLWSDGKNSSVNTDLVLRSLLPKLAKSWASLLDDEDRWDAVLVDEGQDFLPTWWDALRTCLPTDGSGEALLVADRQQNIYATPRWTELEMGGAGFRGAWVELEHSYRMSPKLCQLAGDFVDRFMPSSEEHRPIAPQAEIEFRTVLRWQQLDDVDSVAEECVAAMERILSASERDPIAVAELVCIVDKDETGLEVVRLLRDKNFKVLHTFGIGATAEEKDRDGRSKKRGFFKGDARVKVTTIQSFKGWEGRALVVQISKASNLASLSVAYTAITRLKRDDRGCYLSVVCNAPELREFGASWAAFSDD